MARSPLICRNGHKLPLLQVEFKKNVHIAEPDSTNRTNTHLTSLSSHIRLIAKFDIRNNAHNANYGPLKN